MDSLWAGIPTVVFDGGGGLLEKRAGVSAANALSDNEAGGVIVTFGRKDYEIESGKMIADGNLRNGVRKRLHEQKGKRKSLFDAESFAEEFEVSENTS